jgi:hypothetical protein
VDNTLNLAVVEENSLAWPRISKDFGKRATNLRRLVDNLVAAAAIPGGFSRNL